MFGELSNRVKFRKLWGVVKKQPWLFEKRDELEALLQVDCSDENQRKLILSLLDRFEYMSNDRYFNTLLRLTESIVTDPGLAEGNTQIVAMAMGAGSDSSQFVLHGMKMLFEKYKWRNYGQVNDVDKSYRLYKKNPNYINIVLVDEFLGSGQTAIGRVNKLKRVYSENKINDFHIKVRVMVATQKGADRLKEEGIDIESQIILPRGISDFWDGADVGEKLQTMIDLESILSPSYKERELPSLGFGAAESLYCREKGNAPNSVFPIFWWPFYLSEDERMTLLTRAMGDA